MAETWYEGRLADGTSVYSHRFFNSLRLFLKSRNKGVCAQPGHTLLSRVKKVTLTPMVIFIVLLPYELRVPSSVEREFWPFYSDHWFLSRLKKSRLTVYLSQTPMNFSVRWYGQIADIAFCLCWVSTFFKLPHFTLRLISPDWNG